MGTEAETTLQNTRDNLSAIETMVGHELALVGNRMTWFAMSQSFLFGAYATIATDPNRVNFIDSKGNQLPGEFTTHIILFCVPMIGGLFAFAARRSVVAAGRVLDELMASRGECLLKINEMLAQDGIPRLPVIGTREQRVTYSKDLKRTIQDGELPLWLLPWALGLVWITVLGIRVPWQQIGVWIKSLGPP